MKILILMMLLSGSVMADALFSTEDSAGLKKLNVHTDLKIECTMALGDLKAKVEATDKQTVANPCLAFDHQVKITSSKDGVRKKFIGSVIIIE